MRCGFGVGDFEGGGQHAVGFVEEGGVFAEEGEDGVADVELGADFGVGLDASVSADGVAGFGAACAETLHGPTDFGAVHAGEVACAGGFEDAGGGGFVEGGGVFEDAGVAFVGGYDL